VGEEGRCLAPFLPPARPSHTPGYDPPPCPFEAVPHLRLLAGQALAPKISVCAASSSRRFRRRDVVEHSQHHVRVDTARGRQLLANLGEEEGGMRGSEAGEDPKGVCDKEHSAAPFYIEPTSAPPHIWQACAPPYL
jgi:hypothetical protein